MKKNRVKKIALCGVFSALELTIIYLSSVFSVMDLTISMFTVLFTVVLMTEYGKKPATAVYLIVSVLSLLIVPNKFTPMCYVFFFGFYPIIKSLFDRTGKVLGYLFEFLYFNLLYVAAVLIATSFMESRDVFGIGTTMFYVTMAIANLAFLICDYYIVIFIKLYTYKLRSKFGLDKLFR